MVYNMFDTSSDTKMALILCNIYMWERLYVLVNLCKFWIVLVFTPVSPLYFSQTIYLQVLCTPYSRLILETRKLPKVQCNRLALSLVHLANYDKWNKKVANYSKKNKTNREDWFSAHAELCWHNSRRMCKYWQASMSTIVTIIDILHPIKILKKLHVFLENS